MGDESTKNRINGNFEGNFIGGNAEKVEMTYKKESASVKQEKAEIENLIENLVKMIDADSNLTKEQKDKVLEKVKILTEAVKNPDEPTKKKQAQNAKSALEAMISVLPIAAKIIEECDKIFPLISKLLGL